MSIVFDKTDKGREEISTRKYHLASRLRTLLVMVDGKNSAEDLLHKVAGLGLTAESLNELLEQGFIQKSAEPVTAPAPVAPTAIAATAIVSEAAAATANAAGSDATGGVIAEGQSQFEAIYRFYTETIKSTIGLRGYGLQLKVEKASSIDEFRQIRQAYLEGVLKAQGPEMARSLRDRLDQLLYLNEAPPPMTTIIGINA